MQGSYSRPNLPPRQFGGQQQQQQQQQQYGSQYGGSQYGGGGYGQQQPQYNQQGGYPSQQQYGQPPQGGYQQYQPYQQNDPQQQQQYTQEDLQHLVNQTLDTQEQSANTTRQTAQAALEADRIAKQALAKLGRQGEQLDGVSKNLGVISDDLTKADKKADHLVQLNKRPFFVPVSASVAKASQEVDKANAAQASSQSWYSWLGFGGGEDEAQKKAEEEQQQLQAPVFQPRTSSMLEYEAKVGEWATQEEQNRSRQHEKNISDDLDVVSQTLDSLKMVGLAMGEETRRQNEKIKLMQDQVDANNDKVGVVNKKIKKVLK
ncbi:hypothetical protein HDU97_006372 [Phlyctochytrium planicorne]|nr:hypothetical protein HDU97_006372 [Phlyctochytrium planicorne]